MPRHVYGTYVETLLETVADYPGNARLERRHDRVLAVDRRGDRFVVRLAQGESVVARSVVLATGSRSGTDWAPPGLAGTPRLVADPWRQALPDGDLLLVGTGLSMVDVAIGADRPGRTLHTVSRHDEIPRVHRVPTSPPRRHRRPASPASPPWRSCTRSSPTTSRRPRRRPGTGVRRSTACAPSPRSSGPASARRTSAGSSPSTPAPGTSTVTGCRRSPPAGSPRSPAAGACPCATSASSSARPTGRRRRRGRALRRRAVAVAAVVNCTGPRRRLRTTRSRPARPHRDGAAPGAGRARHRHRRDGRVLGRACRPGAVLDARSPATRQPVGVHGRAGDPCAGLRRRPDGVAGLPTAAYPPPARRLRTAALDHRGGGGPLRTRAGPDPARPGRRRGAAARRGRGSTRLRTRARRARAARPRGWRRRRRRPREPRPGPDLRRAPRRARAPVPAGRHRPDHPPRSPVGRGPDRPHPGLPRGHARGEHRGADHRLRRCHRLPQEAWALVEGLAPAYGDDWWYSGLLAFMRQEQERWDEARASPSARSRWSRTRATPCTPAPTCTTRPATTPPGLAWLDRWISTCGRAAGHRAHFSWHAALHELISATWTRPPPLRGELAPPLVTGLRALVDSVRCCGAAGSRVRRWRRWTARRSSRARRRAG